MLRDSPVIYAVPLIVGVGLPAVPVVLWVCAVPIPRLVTQRLPSELALGTISLVDCSSLAFIGVGLFYLVGHFAEFFTWAHYLFKQAIARPGARLAEEVNLYQVVQGFLPFVAGLVLFVKARVWAFALAAGHTAGTGPGSPRDDPATGTDSAANPQTERPSR